LDDWRARVRRNEEKIEKLCKEAGFSDEFAKWAKDAGCYSKKIALGKTEFMGCEAFLAVKMDSNGTIDTHVYVISPNVFYSGQGFITYQSVRDARFEEARKGMQEGLCKVSKEDREEVARKFEVAQEQLLEKIWDEQVSLISGTVKIGNLG
jgi:hypothetical protein